MREKFVLRMESGKNTTRCLTSVILALVFLFFGNAYGQAFSCATWGDEKTQLIQLEVGESKTFQLPTASVDPNGASCVDDVDDIQYEVRRSTTPVLPEGFTFDEEEVTVSGCSTEVLSGHKFSLVASGPDACSCTPATLEVVFRIKDDDDDSTDPMCSTTGTPPVEDSEDLDQSPPPKPFYGWSQVHLGGRWTQPVGLDETEQGAALTYGARCTGKYDLAENYIGSCPSFLNFIGQSKYENGIVYFTESISKNRSNIGIYRIRITAHKEDVAVTSQTTVVLEVVDDHPAPDSPVITAPALNTLRLVWEVDEDEREYITGFDLEFRKVLGGGRSELYELTNTVTSLTIGSLETDTQYRARFRIRGGQWSDWAQAYTLGNNAPTFEKTEYTFTLTENVSGRDDRIRLGEVDATDPNPQDEVTYSLDSADTDRFTIGASSGILYYIGDGEDHEATPTINVKVTATGGTGARKLESSVVVTVEVTNVSEPLAFAEDAKIEIDDLTLGDYVDIQLPKAIGGDGPVSYSVDPDLPDDLEVERRSGKLKGWATVTSKRTTYSYIATDVEGKTDSLSFSFRIFGKAPKAPTNLSVQRAFADRIKILWENPSTPFVTVVEHEIEYRAKGTSRWKRKRIDAPATSYTITGLTRDTIYQIRIKNIAQSGYVGFSSILEAKTKPYAAPSVPRNVTVVEHSTESLTIEWDKPSDNGGRRVVVYDIRYRKSSTETWTEEETRTTSFTITGLEKGTEYLIGVRAVNVVGPGPWSADLSAETSAYAAPSVPRNVTVEEHSTESLTIEWDQPSDNGGKRIETYDVRYRKTSTETWTEEETRTTSFTITGLDKGTEYLIGVRAVNVVGSGPWSADLSAETNPAVPSVPQNVTMADHSTESLTIEWDQPSDNGGRRVVEYNVRYRKTSTETWTEEETRTTSFTITGLDKGTEYLIGVRAVNVVGSGPWSADLSAETNPAVPSVPQNVTMADHSTESLTIEWDQPSDNGGRRVVVYDVRYRKTSTETWTEEETRTTSFTITGLEQGTEYLIGVRAVNVAGPGAWSADLSASTIRNTRPVFAMGASIPNQSYTVGEAVATLELPRASEGEGTLVYSLDPSLPPGVRFNPNALTLSGTPTVTQTATTYTYTVADSDEFVEDDESVLTFQITVAANTPLTPALVIDEIGYESAQISWSMPDPRGSSITTYDIELRESGQQNNITQHDATSTSFTATNLVPQTSYAVRIRAVNGIGPSDWSVWTEFMTTRVPVEIRSRPLVYALGVVGTHLGEGVVERIGNRANLIDTTQRQADEGYSPPYYVRESDFSLVPKFDGMSPKLRVQNENRSSDPPYSRLLSMLPRSVNFLLNNSNGSTDAENGINWAAWASFGTTRLDANPMEVVDNEEIASGLDAQTTSMWLGAEFEVTEDVRLGIALSHATGDVDLDRLQYGTISNTEQDNVDFSVTSLYPYAVGKLHKQLRVWGTLGRGTGSTTLTDRWGEIDDLGLTATVLAAGVNFNFNENEENGFALKGDLFQSDIDTDDAEDFDGSLSNTVRRMRVGVQGRRYYRAIDIDLVLSGELLGRIEDGGVADGTNIDIGGQVDVFLTDNWSASGQIRIVRSMEADAYQAIGIQFDVRRDSAADGTGLNLQFTPSWGSSSVHARNLNFALPWVNLSEYPIAGVSSEFEISYGIASYRLGLMEPYGTVSRIDFANQIKLGFRVTEARLGFSRFFFNIASFISIERDRTNSGTLLESRLTF